MCVASFESFNFIVGGLAFSFVHFVFGWFLGRFCFRVGFGVLLVVCGSVFVFIVVFKVVWFFEFQNILKKLSKVIYVFREWICQTGMSLIPIIAL